ERERLETELKILERSFYGHGWQEISQGLEATQLKVKQAKIEEAKLEADAKKLETDLVALEKAGPVSEQFRVLRKALDELMGKRTELRERQMKLETQAAVAAARAEQPWTPLPLSKIIASVDTIREKHEALDRLLAAATLDVEALKKLVTELKLMSSKLVTQLQQPAAEPAKKDEKIDPVLKKEALEIAQALSQLADQMSEAQKKMETWNQEEAGERKHIFALQHELNQKRQTAQAAERRASDASIELARFETRREGFLNDLRQHAPAFEQGLDVLVKEINASILSEDASARLQKLRSQLEWIGGIDPETEKEFKETQTRYEFLAAQTKDLRESLEGLALVVQELDATIGERSEKAFRKLDHEFGIFFKKLFNGGEAKLIELVPEPKDKEVDEEQEGEIDEDEEEMAQGFSGIEIQATPPGKRFKAIALLSGGERALTSIALICAIMATNPSPFVVLDEVDAALDESNSRKFAEIINSLADQTQFIVISHNRATMAQANVLYGVTMGDDGVSQLLSVKLEDVEKLRQK
ncbi:hypothetical protein EXS71_03450, partial [Candidatus Uhrbacteria bacterium]|nr:hypothetical protein [Candidatus Uhrbacteria bacterium]